MSSSMVKLFLFVVAVSVLAGCNGSGPSSGNFDSLPPQKQAEAKQSISDSSVDMNKQAMQAQGMENMPAGVGPKFPDPAKYRKGAMPGGAPTPASGGEGAEKK